MLNIDTADHEAHDGNQAPPACHTRAKTGPVTVNMGYPSPPQALAYALDLPAWVVC
jgi:hypothetical protein